MTIPTAADQKAPIYALDMRLVGVLLARAAATSAQLGHAQPRDTSRSYGRAPSPEAQFVRDVLTRSTAEIARRWWGSEFDAWAYICGVVAGEPDPLLDAGGLDAATPAG